MPAGDSTVATVAIGAGASLFGVTLGFVGNLIRDIRREHADRDTTARELRAAARLVWMEIVGFETATHLAAGTDGPIDDDTVIAPLRSDEQLQRYVAVLAREKDFDVPAIEHAYTSARYAAAALLAGAPPAETRDVYQEAFTRALEALARLADINSEHTAAVDNGVDAAGPPET